MIGELYSILLGMVVVMAFRGGEEWKVVATVVDTGDENDHQVPQQAHTDMGSWSKRVTSFW